MVSINVHEKSSQLLERLANSIYDRDPAHPKPFFFNINEIHIVEDWLNDLFRETQIRNPSSTPGILFLEE